MALTRGNRAQSRESSMAAKGAGDRSIDRSMDQELHDASIDVGNSNIEISQSGIHPVSSVGSADEAAGVPGSSRNGGMAGRRAKRMRMRNREPSYDYTYGDEDSGVYDTSYATDQDSSYYSARGRKRGRLQSIFSSIKSFFFTDPHESDGDVSMSRRRSRKRRKYHSHAPHESRSAHRSHARDAVLARERRNRELLSATAPPPQQQQPALAAANASLKSKVTRLQRELQDANEDLKFAREKNTLFEKLLDEANVDRSYVKSRRDIRNLEKHNIKPRDELPPSPERKVNPLVTSSPIRRLSGSGAGAGDHNDARNLNLAPPQINFYSKYPTIPRTESLAMASDAAEPNHDSKTDTTNSAAK